jgi:hypothetical protein
MLEGFCSCRQNQSSISFSIYLYTCIHTYIHNIYTVYSYIYVHIEHTVEYMIFPSASSLVLHYMSSALHLLHQCLLPFLGFCLALTWQHIAANESPVALHLCFGAKKHSFAHFLARSCNSCVPEGVGQSVWVCFGRVKQDVNVMDRPMGLILEHNGLNGPVL